MTFLSKSIIFLYTRSVDLAFSFYFLISSLLAVISSNINKIFKCLNKTQNKKVKGLIHVENVVCQKMFTGQSDHHKAMKFED